MYYRRRWLLAELRHRARFLRIGVIGPSDPALVELADELVGNEERLRALLADDGRDTQDIPGFDALADRQHELIEQLGLMPAQGIAGLVAKARAIRQRDPGRGYDGVVSLGWSLAGDVLRLFG